MTRDRRTEITHPTTAFPITSPILGHPVTKDELLRGRPSDALVRAVLAATGPQRRALTEWSVRHALAGAGILDLRQLTSVLAQFGSAQPVSLTAEASAFRMEARRGMTADDEALSVEGNMQEWNRLKHWGLKSWAMEALAYAADNDDVVAALGATYCAGIQHNADDAERERFLDEALRIIHN